MSNHGLFADVETLVAPLREQDLYDWFLDGLRPARRIGLEIEYGLVRGDTGRSVAYAEPGGAKEFLELLLKNLGGSPLHEGQHLVGLTLPDGSAFSLEMGGAVEYSSPPLHSVSATLELASQRLREAATAGREIGVVLLTGGVLPFDSPADIHWVPKPRTTLMRQHFRRLGPSGSLGDQVMGLTLSTQVSLDAGSESEYIEKLQTMLRVSPFLAAATLNTPSLRHPYQHSSVRILYWRNIDPDRCQCLNKQLVGVGSINDLVQILASLSMIYRPVGSDFAAAPSLPFAELLREGYSDGFGPVMSDWRAHLSQLWPWVRPRQVLEARLPDGQAWSELGLVPALWTGLIEDEVSRRAAADLVDEFSPRELDGISVGVAEQDGGTVDDRIRDVAHQLVMLAKSGIERRVADGVESDQLLLPLERLLEMTSSGRTAAAQLLANWKGKWREDPSRYVAAMAVPVEG